METSSTNKVVEVCEIVPETDTQSIPFYLAQLFS